MAIVITDPKLPAQLAQTHSAIEMQDAKGNYLGTFAPPAGKLPPGVQSPYSDADIEELRKQTGGRPLAEILRDLERGA